MAEIVARIGAVEAAAAVQLDGQIQLAANQIEAVIRVVRMVTGVVIVRIVRIRS